MRVLKWMGHSLSNLFAGIAALMMIAVAVTWATNYTLTQGAGTTFGSLVVAGVNYAQHFICDATTPSQCTAVNSSGALSTQLTGSTNNINNISGTVSLPTGAATAANQAIVNTWASGTLGAMANYGTSPGAVLVPGVNAFMTNANANGANNSANSSPVVIANDQACTNPTHAFKHITSATDTLAVQGVSLQTVRLCAWVSRAAGTATWFWENTASTNANCVSTLTQINGVATEAANTGEVVALPIGVTLNNTSGNGLCINSTGTGGVDIDYWYQQR